MRMKNLHLKVCEGKRVYLRQIRLKDAALVASFKRDPVVRRMALEEDTRITLAGQREDIRRAIGSAGELYLLIVLKKTTEPIGYVRVNWMDDRRKQAWLRFALGFERGKGYAKDALRAFLGHLFSKGAHRVEAEVYEFNLPSLGLLAALGFIEEGRKRAAHFDGERYRDVVLLGLLASDYRNES